MTPRESFDDVSVNNLAVLRWDIFRGRRRVTHYVDRTTGQVVPRDVAYRMGVREIRSDAKERRRAKLESLRPEPRQFAMFLLQFRDAHCKFLMPMGTLIEWYATIYGKQRCHVKRYFKPLIAAGILDSEHILNEDFMVNNRAAGKETSKGDETRAYYIYETLRLGKLEDPSTSMTIEY